MPDWSGARSALQGSEPAAKLTQQWSCQRNRGKLGIFSKRKKKARKSPAAQEKLHPKIQIRFLFSEK
ncbi:MAG: hypothetical protein SOT81_05835 [Treponema sp.]|nr:hypothetical protein [Treponema sp.]